MKQNYKIIILGIILFLGLIITYSNHFNNGFHFDDFHTINDNIYIRNLNNIPKFFSHPEMFSSMPSHWGLRPVVTTTLAIDYSLGGGLNPFFFHLSTFIWYILMCFILYFVYKHILNLSMPHKWTNFFAIITVGWYALHTANAETINYIISRSDVISTFCIVASFAIYILYPRLRNKFLYVIPAIIGVFAKETVLVLPILLFFYIILFEKNLSITDLFKRKNFKIFYKTLFIIAPLLIVIAVVQYYTLSKAPAVNDNTSNPIFNYILTQSYVWVHYSLTLFFPFNLSADTDQFIIKNPFDDKIILGLVFVCLLVYTIFKTSAKKETRPIAFGLIWFVFSLLPTSIMPLTEVLNDHRLFFPYIGLTFSVVSYLRLLILKYENAITENIMYQRIIWILTFIILSLYAYGAYQRNKVWKDEESLWYDVTIKSPQNGRGLMNYGLTQMNKGNYPVALANFEKALVFNPYYSFLHINLGILNNAMNKPVEAEEYFKKAIQYGPNFPESYYYYANYLKQHNRIDDARQMAEKAFNINPAHTFSGSLLMSIYSELEMWDNLKITAEKILNINPKDSSALRYLKSSNNKESKLDETKEFALKNPTPENYVNLSLLSYQKGLYEKCIEACHEALKLNPNYADAYNNICSAYNALGKYDEAIKACEKAVQLKPDFQLAKNNLNWAKSQVKK